MNSIPDMEDFGRLEQQLTDLKRLVLEIHTVTAGGDFVCVEEIARIEGTSVRNLSRKPWLLPDFGVCRFGKRNRKWPRNEFEEWREIPVDIREQRFWNQNRDIV